jgi:N-acetyltransferase
LIPPELHDPLFLRGPGVELVPLEAAHAAALAALSGRDGLWRDAHTYIPPPDRVGTYVAQALQRRAVGGEVPFAILAEGAVAGTTRFQVIQLAQRRLQIGSTWLGAAYRRRGIGTASKRLLLAHAFGQLLVRRVEFMTDPANLASRRALEHLGAQLEGVLRQHLFLHGRSRDSAVYSLLASEWTGLDRPAAGAREDVRATA